MNTKFHVFKINLIYLFLFFAGICFATSFFLFSNVSASEDSPEGIRVPIIMYHSVLKDTSKSGKYVITPSTLEEDLIYLKEKGYTTITMTDLINYVYKDSPLPEKPIILTFDDGHYNNYTYVFPLLEKYQMKAVISIVGKYTDDYTKTNEANANYSYLRWCDINILMQSGYVEFQNHTYNMHGASGRNGSSKKWNESVATYSSTFTDDILKLQEEFTKNTNYTPNTYTYPLGAVSQSSLPLVKQMGFQASLSCSSGVNFIVKDPECLYLLKRFNRPSGPSSEKFFSKIIE